MSRKIGSLIGILLLALIAVLQPNAAGAKGDQFVRRHGNVLKLKGKQFRFAGSNNYYLMYKSQFMVDDVLNATAANGFTVLRTWGWLDIGLQDGTNSIRGKSEGVYFQYWDPVAGAPAYNDGADGLQRLDYVIHKAGQLGIKLVIPLTNNWNDFGGIDQYVRWRDSYFPDDGPWYHDSFYTDATIKQWYKNWIAHMLNRTNSYNGIKYKNDPTIMTWELGNEPRCLSAGAYPRSPNCTTQTLTSWAHEMSTYIKSIDSNHLVSVGDEGFYCFPNATHWTENCGEGVDTIALTRLPNIDVMSFHLYPDHWGTTPAWGTDWIKRHIRDAKANRKAVMLGEYGLLDKSIRNKVYKQWTDAAFKSGGQSGADGALYWILSARQDDGSNYPDFDGFTVYPNTPVISMLAHFAQMMTANRGMTFPPVADNDLAVTEFNTPVTLNPPANDITYGGATLKVNTLDLDPATPGRQTTRTVARGTFVAHNNGSVTFTPVSGVSGPAQITYTIKDSSARLSNEATLAVTIKPDPTAALVLASFEDGTEGWAPGSWQPTAGTVEQSTDFATEGTHSLKFNAVDGGWVGLVFPSPVNLTGKTHVKADIKTLETGTSQDIALQIGPGFEWCQGNFTFVNANSTATTDVDLISAFSCDISTRPMDDIRAIYIFFSGGGTFYLDNVRAE